MAEDKPNLIGKWTVYKSENFEEFLEAAGTNWMARKMAGNTKPTVVITKDGDEYCIKLTTLVFNREEKFAIDKEYDQSQLDGFEYKAMATWEGNKLVLSYTPKVEGKGKAQSITREIIDGDLVMTMQIGDVKAVRYLKKTE